VPLTAPYKLSNLHYITLHLLPRIKISRRKLQAAVHKSQCDT